MVLYSKVCEICFQEQLVNFKVLGKSDRFELDSVLEKSGLRTMFDEYCNENKGLSNTKKYLRFFDSIQKRDEIKDLKVKLSTGFNTLREVYGEMAEYV